MQQRTRRLAFVFAGTLFATVGVLAACSTDDGTTPLPGSDGGRDSAKADGSGNNNDDDGGVPGPNDGGNGADCANVPTVKSSVGPYCFSVVDGGGNGTTKSVNCNAENNEICCSDGRQADGGFALSECKVATTSGGGGYTEGACAPTFEGDGGKEYHCMEKDHCPGSDEACCAIPREVTKLNPGKNDDFPGCQAFYQSGRYVEGTRCKKNGCAPGDLTLCSKDSDCPSGTCVPLTLEGRYGGYCRQ
jgi:hypothetical protein